VWIALGAQALGLLGLMFGDSVPIWIAAASVFGFGMGGMVPLAATLTGQVFGRLSYGKTMGLLRPFQLPLHAIGVPFGGWVFDVTGTYDLAFQVYLLAYVATAVAIAFLGRPYSDD
jgi:cyanate permease